ncbi:ABC transporter ATP-binding protein [Burkholderia multivorans]|uniref:ABC cobalamin/Fe3+-siderophore transporter, ATPase subunit n=2 Tax=Burkholderia multivorans TaxID=87883 RepID=B9BR02_9BURK|nr:MULTISPECIES: ABC transporter ATP-binding protein [Burkholderia]EEE07047.1 ABC cobalamin/Fe3+-siderophore transporter, ATPase subunit [Burkholderia multivorans CGD2]EEE13009.1 ABC cobalamin/Fe3+-siderophore transporter, ATPase subunit [Burkholderia multivorans CGD2M]MBH9661513.1 ABC transporter ATP-binding protein [Burkholderia multivorans]MBU9357460.1 ABC transporter ATP-binding protein [Burkholderia multivorans]MBU9365721.1 ABC transporter ATP-binding protein [Burkholderia multivorans]
MTAARFDAAEQGAYAARDLTLKAGARTLLAAFTQAFRPGEIWCVAGPNGAGKTTLLATLAGLRPPAGGSVEIDGRPLSAWRPAQLAQRRALMPQQLHDAFSATVFDTVLLNRFPYLAGWGWERDGDREAARAALATFGLSALAGRDVLSLSGGERQRVALAATLCQDAPLMLLDEPLAHLDLHHQIDCLTALTDWVHARARTVLFSCHDLNLARRFATHALLLDGRGRAWSGPVCDVLTPERASDAFGYPLVLIRENGRDALLPAWPERRA